MHTCSHACMHACTHARMDTCIAPLAVSSQRDRNLAERERPDVLILTFTRYLTLLLTPILTLASTLASTQVKTQGKTQVKQKQSPNIPALNVHL